MYPVRWWLLSSWRQTVSRQYRLEFPVLLLYIEGVSLKQRHDVTPGLIATMKHNITFCGEILMKTLQIRRWSRNTHHIMFVDWTVYAKHDTAEMTLATLNVPHSVSWPWAPAEARLWENYSQSSPEIIIWSDVNKKLPRWVSHSDPHYVEMQRGLSVGHVTVGEQVIELNRYPRQPREEIHQRYYQVSNVGIRTRV